MSIFAVGDLHLAFDSRIEKPMDIFGDRWKDHPQRLKEFWHENVKNDDIVIIAGDVSWGLRVDEAMADFEWLHTLAGTKIITKGNHDLWWTSVNKMNGLFDDIIFLQNHCYVVEDMDIAIAGSRGWICPGSDGFDSHDEKIFKRELIRLKFSLEEAKSSGAKEIIAVLHYPPTNDKHQVSEFTKMLTGYGVKTCVYGHLHGKDSFSRGFQGFLDGVEYRLISLDYLECKLKRLR